MSRRWLTQTALKSWSSTRVRISKISCKCSGCKRGGEGGVCGSFFVSRCPSTYLSTFNPMGLFSGSSSTTQVSCSPLCVAQGPGTPVKWGNASAATKQVGGSQLSGKVNILLSEKSEGSSKSGSSSTRVLGGEPAAMFP